MKITFITHSNVFYGANRSLFNLIEGLQSYDVHVQVIAPYINTPDPNNMSSRLKRAGIPVHNIPLSWWVTPTSPNVHTGGHMTSFLHRWRIALRHLVSNIYQLPKLIRQIRVWKTDIIYTNSSVVPVGAWASFITRLPHVWHLREFNDLHYGSQYDWGKKVTLAIINTAAIKISISKAVQAYYATGKCHQCYTIYNGIASTVLFDQLRDQMSQRLPSMSNNPYVFVIIGVIHQNKGQEEAIRATALLAKQHPNIRLLIVGDGDTDSLQKLVQELCIADKVSFWGHINDPFEAFLAADAVLMCSRHEAMGRVTVEAMAASLPVIGYASGGTVELIEDGVNGLLYHHGVEDLMKQMRFLVENPDKAREMGANGWAIARQKFSTEQYAKQVYDVLCTLALSRL